MNSPKKLHLYLTAAVTLTVSLGWLYQHASETLCYSKLAFVYLGNLLFWTIAIFPVKRIFEAHLRKSPIHKSLITIGLSTISANQLFVYLFVEGAFSLFYTCNTNFTISDWMLTNGILSNVITFAIIIATYYRKYTIPSTSESIRASKVFQIKQNGVMHVIAAEDIVNLEADNNAVHIHTKDKRFVQYGRLKDWEDTLAAYGFVRIHRSHIVNPQYIQSFESKPSGDGKLQLLTGHKLRVSRSYRSNLYVAGQLQLN